MFRSEGREVPVGVMKRAHGIAAAAATVLLLGAAGQANAQSVSGLRVKPTDRTDTRSAEAERWGPTNPDKTIRFEKRRWGVRLDLEQPVGREPKPKDMQAGAYYRITPSLRVGGSLRLDEKAEDTRRLTPRDQQPRVRLETAFQF